MRGSSELKIMGGPWGRKRAWVRGSRRGQGSKWQLGWVWSITTHSFWPSRHKVKEDRSLSLPYPFLEFPGLSLKPLKQEKWRPLAVGGPSLCLTTTHLPGRSDPTASRRLNSSDQVSEAKRTPRPPASLVTLAWHKAPLCSSCLQLPTALGAQQLGMGHRFRGTEKRNRFTKVPRLAQDTLQEGA